MAHPGKQEHKHYKYVGPASIKNGLDLSIGGYKIQGIADIYYWIDQRANELVNGAMTVVFTIST